MQKFQEKHFEWTSSERVVSFAVPLKTLYSSKVWEWDWYSSLLRTQIIKHLISKPTELQCSAVLLVVVGGCDNTQYWRFIIKEGAQHKPYHMWLIVSCCQLTSPHTPTNEQVIMLALSQLYSVMKLSPCPFGCSFFPQSRGWHHPETAWLIQTSQTGANDTGKFKQSSASVPKATT